MSVTRRMIRSRELHERVPFSDMHLRRLEKAGKFPKRFKISSDARGGAVAWWSDEVDAWEAERRNAAGLITREAAPKLLPAA